ncbi:riboflavin biosynthesis protein [Clostridia bacterium]|nr:riboflavin biosynthesis protein [Clostridia bacterium]
MKRLVAALGFFDGAHIGHAELFKRAKQIADLNNATAAAITFENHPRTLTMQNPPPLLTTTDERRELITAFGLEIIMLPFDKVIMHTPWDAFVRGLAERGAVGLVAGRNFRFGWKNEGNAQRLREQCAELGIGCDIIPEVRIDGTAVSSTYIRKLVEDGDMVQAARFLGRAHTVNGVVGHGKHLGTKLGVPTVNVALPPGVAVPKFGVYASKIGGFKGVTNIGIRPTVDDGDGVTVETTLLDFNGDLYGQKISVELLRFMRTERRFENLDELARQIHEDIAGRARL